MKTQYYNLIEGRHGHFLANPKDMYIGRSIIEYGEFSELEWQLLDKLLRPGMVGIEAGANMGSHTVPIAKKLGLGGMVYAFEPQMLIFQQLCANLALNDLVNVQAVNAGCGDREEWLSMVRPNPAAEANFGGFKLEHLKGDTHNRVRVETLDNALDLQSLHLIKADVEGMEVAVLKGAAGLIAKHRPLLYLEANRDYAAELIDYVSGLDYEIWWHHPGMFNPQSHTGKNENLFGNIVSHNIFCAPAERKFQVNGLRRAQDVAEPVT